VEQLQVCLTKFGKHADDILSSRKFTLATQLSRINIKFTQKKSDFGIFKVKRIFIVDENTFSISPSRAVDRTKNTKGEKRESLAKCSFFYSLTCFENQSYKMYTYTIYNMQMTFLYYRWGLQKGQVRVCLQHVGRQIKMFGQLGGPEFHQHKHNKRNALPILLNCRKWWHDTQTGD
jgi:hypothetical protein